MLRLHAGGGKNAFFRDVHQTDRQTGDIFRDFAGVLFPSLAGDDVMNFAETDQRQEDRSTAG